MTRSMLLACTFGAACVHENPMLQDAPRPCPGQSTPLDVVDDWTGISEQTFRDALAVVPTAVVWDADRMPTPAGPVSTIDLEVVVTGTVVVRDHALDHGTCNERGRELALPIALDISIDGGSITAATDGLLLVWEDDHEVRIDAPDAVLAIELAEPALSESWAAAAQAEIDADRPRSVDRWTLGLGGDWRTGTISIGALGDDWVGAVWRGRWSIP